MSGSPSNVAAAKQPAAPTPPAGQFYASFANSGYPSPIEIQNDSGANGASIVLAWLYPDMTAPVQVQETLSPSGFTTAVPPATDPSGNSALAFVLFNIGQTQVTCTIRR